jgi:hypothetical protein
MARHAATVEDLLGESQPVLRLVVRPWHESLSRRPRPERSRLEIAPPRAGDDAVVVRMWLDCATADRPDEEDRIHESKLSVPLVEALILDFLGRVLLTA